MQFSNMMVYGCGGLSALVPFSLVKIERRNGMITENAPEGDPTIQGVGGVISHNYIVVVRGIERAGQEVLALRVVRP